jgi:hypothetical protein
MKSIVSYMSTKNIHHIIEIYDPPFALLRDRDGCVYELDTDIIAEAYCQSANKQFPVKKQKKEVFSKSMDIPANCIHMKIHGNVMRFITFHKASVRNIVTKERIFNNVPVPNLLLSTEYSLSGKIKSLNIYALKSDICDVSEMNSQTKLYYYPYLNMFHDNHLCLGTLVNKLKYSDHDRILDNIFNAEMELYFKVFVRDEITFIDAYKLLKKDSSILDKLLVPTGKSLKNIKL